MKQLFFISSLLAGLCYLQTTYADASLISVGRYLTTQAATTESQRDSLQSQYQGTFPESVKTVGDAISYLLISSGYQLLAEKNSILTATLNKALPQSVRTIGPVTIQDALIALIGQPYQLLVDPVHRLVSYQIKPVYQSLY